MTLEEKIVEVVKQTIKDGIEEAGRDLFEDMVQDNPEWYAEKLVKVFTDTATKALNSRKLVENIVRDMLLEEIREIDLLKIAEDVIKEKVQSSLVDKLIVEVKRQ